MPKKLLIAGLVFEHRLNNNKKKDLKEKLVSLHVSFVLHKKTTEQEKITKREKTAQNPQHVHHIYISERKTCIYTSVFPPVFI